MNKILIIGSGGAGKSTFARQLSKILQIEVIHLDSLYWQAGWVEMPKPEWKRLLAELLMRDAWIMDGNYSGTLELRIEACDTIIFLDIAPLICLWRIFKRWARYRNQRRPDMAEGCLEKLSFEFIVWILNYRNRTRPKVIKVLQEKAVDKNVLWLRSTREVEKFLEGAKQA
ncbi:MAG: DNA topology modulation protein [Acidobacteriota bacterium]